MHVSILEFSLQQVHYNFTAAIEVTTEARHVDPAAPIEFLADGRSRSVRVALRALAFVLSIVCLPQCLPVLWLWLVP